MAWRPNELFPENPLPYANGTLVFDQTTGFYAALFETLGVHCVVVPETETLSETLRRTLPGRTVVTRYPGQYYYHASSFDFGILSIKGYQDDVTADPVSNAVVRLIARALVDGKLGEKRHGWIWRLKEAVYEDLLD